MKRAANYSSRQRGAALVVGLLLLVIITLLAVTGMTTANTELIMAGNEQQRQNAFRAAEVGLDAALQVVNDVAVLPGNCYKSGPTAVFKAPSDRYTTASLYIGKSSLVVGFSANATEGNHFQVTATGAGARGARTTLTQGLYVITSTNTGDSGSYAQLDDTVPACNPDDPE